MLIKKSKSIIVLILVALMCLSLVGCSSSSKEKSKDNSGETSKSASSLRPEGVPQDYPNKEIQFIYAFGPGSVNEAYFRILADKVREMEGWKNGFVINFKEGASGRIGWSALASAKPDGYSIGFVPTALLIPSIAEKVPFGYDKFSYIFNMMSDPGAIGVAKDSPYKSLKDLVDAAKERPNQISVGVTSTIGQEGLTLKLIEKAAGVKFKAVAFDTEGEIMSAVVGKHLDAFCLNVSDTTSFVEDGQIKILATGGEKRSPFLPDVPTYKESGFDVVQVNMRGIAAPAGIPEPIRQYLENCFMAAAQDPEVKKKAEDMKIPVDSLTGTEFKEKLGVINENLKKLWQNDPWE